MSRKPKNAVDKIAREESQATGVLFCEVCRCFGRGCTTSRAGVYVFCRVVWSAHQTLTGAFVHQRILFSNRPKPDESANEFQTIYHEALRSPHARMLKRQRFVNSQGRCENCFVPYPFRELRLHHETYLRLGSELLSDVRVLCDKCHAEEHRLTDHATQTTFEDLAANALGVSNEAEKGGEQ